MPTRVGPASPRAASGGPPPALADAVGPRECPARRGVTLKRVDGARHFIMIDQPDRLDALIDAFLNSED